MNNTDTALIQSKEDRMEVALETGLGIVLAVTITVVFLKVSFFKKNILKGFLLAFIVSLPAWFLGTRFPVVGGPIFAVIIGTVIGMRGYPLEMAEGVQLTSKRVLQVAIVFFGFNMNLRLLGEIGYISILIILIVIGVTLATAYLVSKYLHTNRIMTILIGVGTAICGCSAIAAVAPVVDAKDKDVATSISTIFIFNILALFIYPFIGRITGMNDMNFGIWAGTAINDTSSVVAAAFSFSDEAGNVATIVKLTRTLMIVPIIFALITLKSRVPKTATGKLRILNMVPIFIIGFIVASIIHSIGIIPGDTSKLMASIGKYFVIIALAAIGLNTDINELIKSGKSAIALGGVCGVVASVTSLLLIGLAGRIL